MAKKWLRQARSHRGTEARSDPKAKPSDLLDTRVIFCGDTLEQLAKLPDNCMDLIYIDPSCEEIEQSFNSNRAIE